MKKFLLIALAVMLVLTSMVVLAAETEEPAKQYVYTGKKNLEFGEHYVKPNTTAKNTEWSEDCTESTIAWFECADPDCLADELLMYEVPCEEAHLFTKDGVTVGSEYKDGKTATCKEPAIKIYEKCLREGCKATNIEITETGDHVYPVDKDGKIIGEVLHDPATECNVGLVIKYTCTVCGESVTSTDDTNKHDHNLQWGSVLKEDKEVIEQLIKTPTCVEGGWYKHFQFCVNPGCDFVTNTQEDSVEYKALNHQAYLEKLMTIKKNAAGKDAETIHQMAARVYADTKSWQGRVAVEIEGAPKGYKGYLEPSVADYKAATCCAPGYLTISCTEDECGATYTVELPQLPHKYVFSADEKKAYPTCTEVGYIRVTCEYEGCPLDEAVEVKPLTGDHDYVNTKVADYWTQKTLLDTEVQKYDAESKVVKCFDYTLHETCDGYTQTVTLGNGDTVKITVKCGEVKETPKAGDASKHVKDEDYHVEKEATCKDDGEYWDYCSKCGLSFGETIDHTKVPHTYEEKGAIVVVDATCTEPGKTTKTCDICGLVTVIDHPASGHYYIVKEEISEANCVKQTDEVTLYVCVFCGDEYTDTIPYTHRVNRDFDATTEKNAYKAPTCTEPGSITFECFDCHLPQTEIIPAHGHAWEFDKVAAYETNEYDFTAEKVLPKTLSQCKKIYKIEGAEEDGLAGEFFQSVSEATCVDKKTYYRTCVFCTPATKDNKAVGTTVGHTLYDAKKNKEAAFVITSEPTCEKTGVAKYNCAVCGDAAELTLPKLPCNIVTEWDDEARKFVKICKKATWAEYNWDAKMDDTDYLADVVTNEKVKSNIVATLKTRLELIDDDKHVPGVGCGESNPIEINYTKYSFKYDAAKETVTITPDDKGVALDNPLLRVTWSYTLSDGTIFSYTRNFKEDKDNFFELGGAETPTGAVLDTITVIVVDKSGLSAADAIKQGYGWKLDVRK